MPNPGGYLGRIGLALPGASTAKLLQTNDTPCPAGSATTIASNPISSKEPGPYFVFCLGWIAVAFGAAVPTALSFAFTTGSVTDSHALNPALFVASTTVIFPIVELLDAALFPNTFWSSSGGQTLSYTVTPTTNGVTVRGGGQILAVLIREAD